MEAARLLLGRPFEITGMVVHGDKRGRTIGFPTANVQALEGAFIPASGVYAVRLLVQNKWYDGVCNVGYKPTFKDPNNKQLSIEVHILNFEKIFTVKKYTLLGINGFVVSENSMA